MNDSSLPPRARSHLMASMFRRPAGSRKTLTAQWRGMLARPKRDRGRNGRSRGESGRYECVYLADEKPLPRMTVTDPALGRPLMVDVSDCRHSCPR